jgi:hypothetical protein
MSSCVLDASALLALINFAAFSLDYAACSVSDWLVR